MSSAALGVLLRETAQVQSFQEPAEARSSRSNEAIAGTPDRAKEGLGGDVCGEVCTLRCRLWCRTTSSRYTGAAENSWLHRRSSREGISCLRTRECGRTAEDDPALRLERFAHAGGSLRTVEALSGMEVLSSFGARGGVLRPVARVAYECKAVYCVLWLAKRHHWLADAGLNGQTLPGGASGGMSPWPLLPTSDRELEAGAGALRGGGGSGSISSSGPFGGRLGRNLPVAAAPAAPVPRACEPGSPWDTGASVQEGALGQRSQPWLEPRRLQLLAWRRGSSRAGGPASSARPTGVGRALALPEGDLGGDCPCPRPPWPTTCGLDVGPMIPPWSRQRRDSHLQRYQAFPVRISGANCPWLLLHSLRPAGWK